MGNHSFVINDGPIWWSCSSTAAGIVVLDSGEIIPEETITAVRLDDLYLLEERGDIMGVDDRTIVPFKSVSEFAAEDAKLAELKKSSKLEDKLTALLMEPDVDNQDPTGLWYSFAHPKALAIMKRFNVTDKSG